MPNTVISLRSSGATGNTPSLGVLANGELSLNFADGILYYKTAANTLGSIRTTQPSGLNQEIQFNDSGSFGADSGLTYNKTTDTLTVAGQILGGTLKSTQSSGDEGGQIDLALAATNQSLNSGVAIDIFQNRLRIFETGGTNRGVFIDMANSASAGVGTDLLNPTATPDTVARASANAAYNHANGAFDKANSANVLAQAAFNQANSVGGFTANSVATLTNKTFDVSVGSNNIFSIQGQSITSYSGSGQVVILQNSPTISVLNVSDSQLNLDGGSGSLYWSGQSGVAQSGDLKAGVYSSNPTLNNSLFTFGGSGANNMSVAVEGSLFIGTAMPSNNGGLNTTYPGWLVVQSGAKFGGTINTLGALQFDDSLTGKIIFANGTEQNTAYQNIVWITANSAFDKANLANVLAQNSYDFANTINVKVDSAYAFANTVNIKTDAAFTQANSANVLAQDGYNQANTATTTAGLAYNHANGAFDKANSATTTVGLAYDHANGAFDKANTATTTGQAAFDKANTVATTAQNAYDLANGTAGVANTDFTTLTASAGTYGNASHVPVTTLTANGRVSSITNTPIAITTTAVSGVFGYSSGGTNATSYTTGQFITSNGTALVSVANTGTAGTYANATHVPVITTDDYGRVSSVTNTAISFPVTSVAGVTGAVSNTQLINGIIAVDGAGSELDADLLDGLQGTSYANATFAQAAFDKANQSAQLAFTTVAANGINVVADANNDTLTLSAANGVGITADASSDTITINLTPTGVTSGTYGGATQIPTFVVDTQGRLTSASNVAISTNLSIAADTGLNSVALATDTLTFVGGDGITSSIGPADNVRFDVDNTVIRTSGNQTITGNLSITGNLNVVGNTIVSNVTSLVVNDPLIQLAANNETSDAIDIGFYGHYSDDGGTSLRHAGLFRDTSTSDKRFILFTNLIDPGLDNAVAVTVNTAQTSFATANLQTNIVGGRVSGLTQAIAIADGGTNATSFNTGNLIFFNGTSLAAIANTGTAGTYANASHVPVITTDAYGRVSSVTNTAIAIATSQITSGTLADARLPTLGTAGTYGNNSFHPVITTDAYGRVTAVTNTIVQIAASQVTSGVFPFAQGGSNNTTYTTGAILTSNGTAFVALANTGTAGTYANASHVPVITTDAYGRVSGITNTSIALATSQITSGTLPIARGGTNQTTYTTGAALQFDGTSISTLANTGTAGTYANATHVPVITTDAYGRVSGVTNTAIALAASAITSGTLPVARGGTNQTTFTNGIIAFNGTSLATLANTGTAATYANATHVPVITTDAYGRVSSVTNTAIAIDASAITSGTLPVARGGTGVTTSTGTGSVVLNTSPTFSGTITTGTGVGGIITGANVIYSNVFVANTNGWTSANVGTAGTYGNSTHVPVITTDAYGRVSSVTTSAITGGGGGGTQNVTIATFNTTANGTTLSYDLGFNPATANAIFVTIDGVVQPESTYTVNTTANTITFGVEPAATENVRVVAFAPTNPYILADGSIDPSKLSVSTNNFIVATALDAAVALAIALG